MRIHILSKTISTLSIVSTLLVATLSWSVHAEVEINGTGALQQRYFMQDAVNLEQDRAISTSAFAEVEFYSEFNDGDDSILFKPFYRLDETDGERTHADIRELVWLHVGDSWELRTGITKVFWGQTESLHLVDIINQTDAVESVDNEEKLGQPMVNLSIIQDWGTTSFYVLPYFRERTFAGREGRLRFSLPIDIDNAVYESDDEERNVDWAIRWQHTLGAWDIGLGYFDGTSREPSFLPPEEGVEGITEGGIRPYYPQIQQSSIDMLAVLGSWLLKFEGIRRESNQDDFYAAVGGFEYTQVGVFDTEFDLGWLMEYQYDDRLDTLQTLGQDDIMIGSRIVFNDIEGTEILFGIIQDLEESSSRMGLIEASSRISDNWKWRIDAYFMSSDLPSDPLYQVRRDDFVELSLEFYF